MLDSAALMVTRGIESSTPPSTPGVVLESALAELNRQLNILPESATAKIQHLLPTQDQPPHTEDNINTTTTQQDNSSQEHEQDNSSQETIQEDITSQDPFQLSPNLIAAIAELQEETVEASEQDALVKENEALRKQVEELEMKVEGQEKRIEQLEKDRDDQERRMRKLEMLMVDRCRNSQESPLSVDVEPVTPHTHTPHSNNSTHPSPNTASTAQALTEITPTPHQAKHSTTNNKRFVGKENTFRFKPDGEHVPLIPSEVRQKFINDDQYIELMNSSRHFSHVARKVASLMFTYEERANSKIVPGGNAPVLDQDRIQKMKCITFDICKVGAPDRQRAWRFAKDAINAHTRYQKHAKRSLDF